MRGSIRGPLAERLQSRGHLKLDKMAETIADKSYVNTSVDAINQRILGRYQNGLGKTWDDPNHMKFFNDGAVNFPYLSDGMWFLTQHKRWGLLKDHPDYAGVARAIPASWQGRVKDWLVQQGVAPGDRVGLCLDRSADMIVAMLGVLKAGAAYVPIDPAHSGARLDFVLADAAPSAVITSAELRPRLEGRDLWVVEATTSA